MPQYYLYLCSGTFMPHAFQAAYLGTMHLSSLLLTSRDILIGETHGPGSLKFSITTELLSNTQNENNNDILTTQSPTCLPGTYNFFATKLRKLLILIQVVKHSQTPRSCERRSRSCRKAQEAPRWSWYGRWSGMQHSESKIEGIVNNS